MTDTFKPHSPEKYGAETSPRLQQMQLILDEYINSERHDAEGATVLGLFFHDDLNGIAADVDVQELLISNGFVENDKPNYFEVEYIETRANGARTHHRTIAAGKTIAGRRFVIGSSLVLESESAVETVFIVHKMKAENSAEIARRQHQWDVMSSEALGGDRENYDSLGLVDPVLQNVLRIAQRAFPGGTILDLDPQDDEL
jgi:hypothetical protein